MSKIIKTKIDILDLTRNAVGLINLKNIYDIDCEIDKIKRIDYLKEIDLIYKNPVFKNEISRMLDLQIKFTACNAIGDQVLVGRGGINVLSLLEERFQSLSNEYREKLKQPDKNFDKFKII